MVKSPLEPTTVLDIRSDFEQPLESAIRPYRGVAFHSHSDVVPITNLKRLGQTIRYVVMCWDPFRNDDLLLNVVSSRMGSSKVSDSPFM